MTKKANTDGFIRAHQALQKAIKHDYENGLNAFVGALIKNLDELLEGERD